jgi:DNA-binding transcriptional regulator YbjK
MTIDRRALIADAAIATLASEGMRGLTHRAVDRAAGLSEGSTSYYFRTREALIFATLARLAELDTADIDELSTLDPAPTVDAIATLMSRLIRRWVTDASTRTLARYELTLESTRRPELQARLLEHRAVFVTMAETILAAAGATAPHHQAHELAAFVDGLVYHRLTGTATDASTDPQLLTTCHNILAIILTPHP